MATYTIIAEGETPGPGEINAGQEITVSDGDTFIVDAGVDGDIGSVLLRQSNL